MTESSNFLERYWWLPLARGIAALLFGIAAFTWPGLTTAVLVLLVAVPAAGILSLVWLIGSWAIVFGIVLTVLAFFLRRAGKDLCALAAAR